MPYLQDALSSRAFQAIYPKEQLVFSTYLRNNECPMNDQLCQEAVWLPQNLLLAKKKEMDQIAVAIEKIQKNAPQIDKNL